MKPVSSALRTLRRSTCCLAFCAKTRRSPSQLWSVESIGKKFEGPPSFGEKVSTSVDLPLSNECKRVLAYAAEEAERLGAKRTGSKQLFFCYLREENDCAFPRCGTNSLVPPRKRQHPSSSVRVILRWLQRCRVPCPRPPCSSTQDS